MLKRSLIIALTLLLIVATPVLAYTYYTPINVVESSGNSYTQLPIIATINNQFLVDTGYISPTGLDTRVLLGPTSVPHTVAADRTLFVSNIAANSTSNFRYTFGNDALDTFYIIVGHNGYITVGDYDALELGSNFEIELKGWIDTSADSDKNLVYKAGAFRTYISAEGAITSRIFALGESYTTGDGDAQPIDGVDWEGQTFTTGDAQTIVGVRIKAYTLGSPGTVTVSIKATTGEVPTGEDLTSGTIDGDTLTTDTAGAWYNIDLTECNLSAGTMYAIVVRATSGDVDNRVYWRYDGTSPTYAGGTEVWSDDSGGTWTKDASRDQMFETLIVGREVTASEVSSGMHTVKTIATGGGTDKLQIWVGDGDAAPTLRQEVNLNGASAPDSSDDWVLSQNNVIPYMEYYKHTVGGTLIAQYQPDSIIGADTPPVVQGRSSGATTVVDTTSHAITLPASIASGELLLVVFSVDGNPTCSDASGLWTKLDQTSYGTTVTGAIFYKIAEGEDSLTITTSAAEQSSHVAFRISDAVTPTGTAATGSSTNSDPPLHNPIVPLTYIWIATRSGDSTVVATAAPTDFSNLQTQAAADANGASTNTAERTLTASSANPNTFTSATEQWVSYTISVPPEVAPRLLDSEGTAQDGIITWGSNPEGVAATIGGLVPTGVVPPVTTEVVPSDVVPETEGVPLYDEAEGANLPMYPFVRMVADMSGWPIQVFWISGAFVLAALAGALALMFFKSITLAAFATGTALAAAASTNPSVIPWWPFYVYVFMAVAFIVYQRVHAV